MSQLAARRASHALAGCARPLLAPRPACGPCAHKALPPTRASRACATPITAGLKKERKKLAKVMAKHRQRLEYLLQAASELPTQLEDTLAQLNIALGSLEEEAAAIMRSNASSSSSTSSSSSSASSSDVRSSSDDEAELLATARRMMGVQVGEREQLLVHALGGSVFVDVPPIGGAAPPPPALALSAEAAGRVMVCTGSKCCRRGAGAVLEQAQALTGDAPGVSVIGCKCLGKCKQGPAVRVKATGKEGVVYSRVRPASVAQLLGEHFGSAS